MPLLEAALNGGRTAAEHPRVPRTPRELARDAGACVKAGARVLHLHPYDESGSETLAAGPCAAAIREVRAACPTIPDSLSTSEAIEPDPARRLALIAEWTELPELVTANQGEEGIVELCQHLLGRGVGIEAGLLAVADAEAFVASPLPARCTRALAEPLDPDPGAMRSPPRTGSRRSSTRPGFRSSRSITVTAARAGRSTSARSRGATASAPGWRTPR